MATTSFNTTFDLTLAPKQFILVDTSDWVGQGIAVADVNSSFNITSPSGTLIYNNTDYTALGCDINTAVSTTNQTAIQLPLGLDGFPEPGVYTLVMTTYDSNLLVYYTKTISYTYSYVQPVIHIQQTAQVVYSPLFTSVDTTNYVVNGITPVIDRVHTIDFPYGSAGEGSPVVGTAAVISTSIFYNGTQTTEIVSGLTYTFTDGLIVIDEISGNKEILVDGRIVCSIYCCLRSTEQMWIAAPSNTPEKARLEALFTEAMSLVGIIQIATTCGKSVDISGYLDTIKTLLHCTDDCDCSGDEPTQIMGLGGLVNNVVIASAGSPLTVTPVTVGNTTTYTISFDAALLTKLNGLYNTVVTAGDNITVVDSGIISGVRTFEINGEEAVVVAGDNIIVTPSVPIAGVITYEIDGEASVVTAGDNITVTPSGPIAGVTTFEINGELSTVSEGYGITVTPSVPVAGVTDFEVKANLSSYYYASSSIGQSISGTGVTLITGITATVALDGDYCVIAEADIDDDTATVLVATYYLIKNGTLQINSGNVLIYNGSAASKTQKIFTIKPNVLGLIASDTIDIAINITSLTGNIIVKSGSINLIKTA